MKDTRYKRIQVVCNHMHETSTTHLWKQKAEQGLPGCGVGEGQEDRLGRE